MQLGAIFNRVTAPDSLEHSEIQRAQGFFFFSLEQGMIRYDGVNVPEVSEHKRAPAPVSRRSGQTRRVSLPKGGLGSFARRAERFLPAGELELNLAPSVCQEKTRRLWECAEACRAAKRRKENKTKKKKSPPKKIGKNEIIKPALL